MDQLAYPHAATLMSASAQYGLRARAAGIPARMGSELNTQTHFRARTAGIPRLIRKVEANPPVKLPRSAKRKGIQANAPICFRLKPRASLRYCGSQKT